MSGIVAEKQELKLNCGIPGGCPREVPRWIILIDNAPVLALFVLGAAIVRPLSLAFSLGFLIYCALAIVLFWRLICPYCHHYNTKACPCGYGQIAPKFFRARKGKDFKKVFRQNIVIMFPCWLIPFAVGIHRLWTAFSWSLLGLFLAFCIIGFVAIPVIAKLIGCKGCEMKDQCPWMARGWAG